MKPAFLIKKSLQQVAFIFSIVLIFSGCNLIDDFIDDFKKEDPTATKVIGPAGGEINFEGIIIQIPENAFSGDNEVSIIVLENSSEFDGHSASSLFQVSGMPNSTSKPIRIKIKYNGTLEGEPLIALGEMKYSVSLDSTLHSYHTEKAVDSSGYLIFDLPAYSKPEQDGQFKSNFLGNAMNFIALNAYTLGLSSGGHFALSYPLSYDKQGILMGEYFENAYDTCAKMGFSYKVGSAEYGWPARVMALSIAPGTGGFYTSWGAKTMSDKDLQGWVKDGDFTINTNILSNDNQLRVVCGHEFLHLVQNMYEFSSGTIEPEQAWLMEATAVWVEEKYSNTPYYYSSAFNNREDYPFDGIQYVGRGYAENGYGLTVLIKDIAEVYGENAVVKIHEKIKGGILPGSAVDPLDAIFSVLNEPVDEFCYRLFSSYILGHYYNKQASTKILDQVKMQHTGYMITPEIKTKTFNHKYHDLSGELFWVSGGDFSSSSKVPLSFIVDDALNCGIMVCKYKAGGEISLLGEVSPGGNGQVILDDAKPVFGSGYDIVVLVVNTTHDDKNNYQGTNEVNLRIDIISGMTAGKVEFYLDNAVFQRNDEPYPYTLELSEVLHLHDLTGRLSGSIYNGSYSYKSLGRTFSGNISLTFAEDPDRVSLTLNHTMSYQGNFGFGERKFHYTVYYNDIPYESFDTTSGMFVYSETGSSVSKINITWKETNSLYTNTLQSHNCGSSSFIRVAVDSK